MVEVARAVMDLVGDGEGGGGLDGHVTYVHVTRWAARVEVVRVDAVRGGGGV